MIKLWIDKLVFQNKPQLKVKPQFTFYFSYPSEKYTKKVFEIHLLHTYLCA